MLNLRNNSRVGWKKVSQLFSLKAGVLLGIVFIQSTVYSYDIMDPSDSLATIGRSPATYTPNDDVILVPQAVGAWSQNIMVEDDAGIMTSMRSQIEYWQKREQFVREWDLADTGIYEVPDAEEQKRYFNRNILRYLDKRLSGEVKRAETGSTMHSVGKVHNALRPKAEAGITKDIKLKFRAKVLQGRGYVYVENPYVDANAMVSATGRIELKVEKSFKEIGVHSRLQYNVDQDVWIAQVDKSLTSEISARISNEQNIDSAVFGGQANQTVQLLYSHSF